MLLKSDSEEKTFEETDYHSNVLLLLKNRCGS